MSPEGEVATWRARRRAGERQTGRWGQKREPSSDEGASRPRSETQADLHSDYCVPGWNLAACLTRRGRSGGQPGTPEARFLHRKSSGGSWNRGSVVADAARGPPEGCARVARETTFLARPGPAAKITAEHVWHQHRALFCRFVVDDPDLVLGRSCFRLAPDRSPPDEQAALWIQDAAMFEDGGEGLA